MEVKKLYKVDVSFTAVVAAHENASRGVMVDILENNIANIVDSLRYDPSEVKVSFNPINSVKELPKFWYEYSVPYTIDNNSQIVVEDYFTETSDDKIARVEHAA